MVQSSDGPGMFSCPVCGILLRPSSGDTLKVLNTLYDNSKDGWSKGAPRVTKIGECVECGYDVYVNVKEEVFK